MTGDELNQMYGSIIAPDARVSVPTEWMPAILKALQDIADLPSEIRAFFIIVAIGQDAEGDLVFSTAGLPAFIGSEGMRQLRGIIDVALHAVKGSLQ